MIRCDAVTPDGRTLHFDDILTTGKLVEDRDQGGHYLVGLDQGAEPPRLHPVDAQEYHSWWGEQARKRDEHRTQVEACERAAAPSPTDARRDALRNGFDELREVMKTAHDELASYEANADGIDPVQYRHELADDAVSAMAVALKHTAALAQPSSSPVGGERTEREIDRDEDRTCNDHEGMEGVGLEQRAPAPTGGDDAA